MIDTKPLEQHVHALTLARGPWVCEARVWITYRRMAGHEPFDARVYVGSVRAVFGGASAALSAERWLDAHHDDVERATVEGIDAAPCAHCDALADPDWLDFVEGVGFCCADCAARFDAEHHEEPCACAACARTRREAEGDQLARESQTRGGLSPEAFELFGLVAEED